MGSVESLPPTVSGGARKYPAATPSLASCGGPATRRGDGERVDNPMFEVTTKGHRRRVKLRFAIWRFILNIWIAFVNTCFAISTMNTERGELLRDIFSDKAYFQIRFLQRSLQDVEALRGSRVSIKGPLDPACRSIEQ